VRASDGIGQSLSSAGRAQLRLHLRGQLGGGSGDDAVIAAGEFEDSRA